jgi:chromosome segregation ATPase
MMIPGLSTVKIAIVGAVILAVLGGMWYVTGLRADLERSQNSVQELKSAVQTQHDTISSIREDQQMIRSINSDLMNQIRIQNQELDRLEDRFARRDDGDQSFGTLAASKPGLVENIINKATSEALRCTELAMGAELTEEETSATKKSQINSECPSLANPNYTGP